MIGNLTHIAIAVPDLDAAILQYQNAFGAFVTSPRDLPKHVVRIAVVNLANTKIELITPLGKASPIQKFLEKNIKGGFHHLCYEVADIATAQEQLKTAGIQAVDNGKPKLGYRGNPVPFFNTKDLLGVLIELEELCIALESRAEGGQIDIHNSDHKSCINSLESVEGVEIEVEADFRQFTPPDNREGN